MKLFLEKDNGEKIELKEITGASENSKTLFFFLKARFPQKDRENFENELSLITGKQCVILDGVFVDKIMGV